jgi:uncharacterized Fe-S cluster-containing radical SAM superfamily enzyme
MVQQHGWQPALENWTWIRKKDTKGKIFEREITIVEVRLESREIDIKIRITFVAKKKQGEDLGRVHASNSVGLATRERVEIMWVTAKPFTEERVKGMFVLAFSSCPVQNGWNGF